MRASSPASRSLASVCLPLAVACSDASGPAQTCRPITTVELVGTPTRIWSSADKVEPYHLPDGVFDAYWSRGGVGQALSVTLNLPGSENYRMRGPSLLELQNDRAKTFSSAASAEDPAESATNYRHWITGTYTLDGTTVHALGHHEWYGCLPTGDCSGLRQLRSWVASLTHFTSTDGGATWRQTSPTSPPVGHVVARPQPWPGYPMDGPYYNHYGLFMPSGLIREGEFFYSVFWYLHRTGDGPSGIERQGISMLRTRDISRPAGWEVLDAAGVYQGLATAQEPFGLILPLVFGSHSHLIVYDPVACRYVLFFAPAHLEGPVQYSTSTTLSAPSWSTPATVTGTETLTHDGYIGVIDPSSGGMNFEFVGEDSYLFYALTDPGDVFSRELFRRPLRINHQPPGAR